MDQDKVNDMWKDTKEKEEEINSGGGGSSPDFWSPEPGKNVILVCPSWDTDYGKFWQEVATHFNVSTGTEEGEVIRPCRRPHGEVCPICELVNELDKGSEKEQKKADRMYASLKSAINVVPLITGGEQENDFSVKIYKAPMSSVMDEIMDDFNNPNFENVVAEDRAIPFKIKREGRGQGTSYTTKPYDTTPIKFSKYGIEIPDDLSNLEERYDDPGYETLDGAIAWSPGDENDDDDDSSDDLPGGVEEGESEDESSDDEEFSQSDEDEGDDSGNESTPGDLPNPDSDSSDDGLPGGVEESEDDDTESDDGSDESNEEEQSGDDDSEDEDKDVGDKLDEEMDSRSNTENGTGETNEGSDDETSDDDLDDDDTEIDEDNLDPEIAETVEKMRNEEGES